MAKRGERPSSNARKNASVKKLEVLHSTSSNRILEQRLAFDGAIAPAIVQAETATPAHMADVAANHDAQTTAHATATDLADSLSKIGPVEPPRGRGATIVFIDGAVSDPAVLASAAPAGAEIVMLDGRSDGLDQIAAALAGRSNIEAVHIVSHGAAGELILGNATITSGNLAAHADDLAIIKSALSATGDILLYGCDVAAGPGGEAFVAKFAGMTGADVAASVDDTGSAARGGNWTLEDHVGAIEATTIAAADYDGLLAPLILSATTAPIVTGAGGVGTTIVWQNAGTIGSTIIDLHATITSNTSGVAPTFGVATPDGIAPADDPYILLNAPGSVTLHWEIFQAGSTTVRAVGTPTFQTTDIDGIGGSPFTRETVSPSVYHLSSYTLDNPTNLIASISGTQLNISGTQNQNAEPTSLASFTWANVSSWDLTYTLTPNAVTPLARTLMDGNGSLTFVNPQTTYMLALDLDANNSTASGTGYANTFTENGGAVAIADTDLAITQHSSLGAGLDSATITLTNAKAGDELLVGTLPSGITSSIDTSVAGQITVKFTGASNIANYEAAIRAVQFNSTSSNPATADRLIDINVHNATFDTTSVDAFTTIHVVSVNDAPAGADKSITTNEDAPYAFTAADFGFTDPNDTPANALLAVKITTLPTGGTLRDNGVAVSAGQVVALADITSGKLVWTPPVNANGNALAAFTFQVRDDGGTANGGVDLDQSPNTITFNVTAVNDAPAGADKTITTLEDTAVTLAAADFGFTDPLDTPANALLAIKITTLPAGGSLRDNGAAVTAGQVVTLADITSGKLVWAPGANTYGAGLASFTFRVQDDGGTANGGVDLDPTPNTIIFNVTTVNDAPAGADKTITTNEDTAVTLAAADFGFTDSLDTPANTLLAVKITTLPADGSLRDNGAAVTAGQVVTLADITSGKLVWTPAANANGAALASFTFQVQDNGGTANGGADTDPTPNTITVDVDPVNDAPVEIVPAATTSGGDSPIVFSTATGNALSVSDVDAGTGLETVTLSVLHGTLTLASKAGLTFTTGDGTTDPALVFKGTIANVNAALDGLVYTPAAGYNGADTLSFTTNDNGNTGSGGALSSGLKTVALTVYAPPVANSDAFATTTDLPITFGVLGNDTDLNAFPLTVTAINGTPIAAGDAGIPVTGGLITLDANKNLTFTPDAGYTGTPAFTYTIDDGHGGTATATVNGSVSPLNHPPVNLLPADQFMAAATLVLSSANGNAVQLTDDASATAIIQTTVSVDLGTLTLKQTTGLTFLAGDGTADATITIKGTKAAINAALDGMTYTAPVGSAATSAHLTIATNDLGQPNGEDIPNGSFETTLVAVAAGQQTVTNQSNVPGWTTTATDHMIEIWGSGFLGVPAYEGIHFAELNANQVAADINTTQIPKGQPLEFSFAHRGRQGVDTMNVTVVDAGTDGVFGTADDVTLMNQNYADGNAAWGAYHKDLGVASGNPIRLIFNSVSSAGGINSVGNFLDAVHLGTTHLTDTDKLAINLNHPPLAVADTVTTPEDTAVTIAVRGNDSDPDGDPVTVRAVTQGTHGSVAIDPISGNPVYTPAANFNGTDTFTYTISDGRGGFATATVTVTVTAVDDAPVNTLPSDFSAIVGTPLALTGLSIGDVDAGSANVSVTLGVEKGTLTLLANIPGGLTAAQIAGNGSDTITIIAPLSAIDATLAASHGLVFTAAADASGIASLAIATNDLGNTGSGGPLFALNTALIAIDRPPIAGADTFPLPSTLVSLYLRTVSSFPPYLVNFFKYPCIISDDKFRAAFNWAPKVCLADTIGSTVAQARSSSNRG